MDVVSLLIGVLAGGFVFGVAGMLIGVVFGSMANRIDRERKIRARLEPQYDGSVRFN